MDVTEIRIKLVEDTKESRNERLLAFCSITFDNMFVVRDLKIIEGTRGCFVAMPSRKLTDRCPSCGGKNHLRARFCSACGSRLNEGRAPRDGDGRAKLHADVAHPINSAAREFIQGAIIKSYKDEIVKAKQPGYVCRYDEIDAGDYDELVPVFETGAAVRQRDNFRTDTAHGPRSTPAPRQTSGVPTTDRTTAGREFGAGLVD
ncbi:MAG TPA: SpoVG family protein [Gemmatales bacterium]|nr:SpoVG family protein [Gemmatales bacterium]